MKAVDELKAECHQKCDPQQNARKNRRRVYDYEIGDEVVCRVNKADGKSSQKNGGAYFVGRLEGNKQAGVGFGEVTTECESSTASSAST